MEISQSELDDDIGRYTAEVLLQMQIQQNALFKFIGDLGINGLTFSQSDFFLGAAYAFDQLPHRHKTIPLTEDEVKATRRRMVDNINPEYGGGNVAVFGFGEFAEALRIHEPVFHLFAEFVLVGMRENNSTEKQEKDFVLGLLVTVLPFYMRSESEQLGSRYTG